MSNLTIIFGKKMTEWGLRMAQGDNVSAIVTREVIVKLVFRLGA